MVYQYGMTVDIDLTTWGNYVLQRLRADEMSDPLLRAN